MASLPWRSPAFLHSRGPPTSPPEPSLSLSRTPFCPPEGAGPLALSLSVPPARLCAPHSLLRAAALLRLAPFPWFSSSLLPSSFSSPSPAPPPRPSSPPLPFPPSPPSTPLKAGPWLPVPWFSPAPPCARCQSNPERTFGGGGKVGRVVGEGGICT